MLHAYRYLTSRVQDTVCEGSALDTFVSNSRNFESFIVETRRWPCASFRFAVIFYRKGSMFFPSFQFVVLPRFICVCSVLLCCFLIYFFICVVTYFVTHIVHYFLLYLSLSLSLRSLFLVSSQFPHSSFNRSVRTSIIEMRGPLTESSHIYL